MFSNMFVVKGTKKKDNKINLLITQAYFVTDKGLFFEILSLKNAA